MQDGEPCIVSEVELFVAVQRCHKYDGIGYTVHPNTFPSRRVALVSIVSENIPSSFRYRNVRKPTFVDQIQSCRSRFNYLTMAVADF